jgi:uncharacterized protein YbjT (DUF2867 family)
MVMRIAIVGGTGTLGRHVAAELARRGHDARVLSRSGAYPVDLTTGDGLSKALDGCAVVVDASNATSSKRARQVLVEGSGRLLAAEQEAGVGHHVCVSIVGCDQVPMGYYRIKTDQEHVVEHGPVPWTIVRATQFHELAATALAAAAKYRVLPIPSMRLQTIAAAEVAEAVATTAEAEPGGGGGRGGGGGAPAPPPRAGARARPGRRAGDPQCSRTRPHLADPDRPQGHSAAGPRAGQDGASAAQRRPNRLEP